ncbi:MAG: hypothetical protein F9B45_28000 [Phycisphaera sp. RhM]|nr:hypothetical protein [Phycisphaera sp. RhM]
MDTCNQAAFIQTNHGVCYPLVGPARINQTKLLKANDSRQSTKQFQQDPDLEIDVDCVTTSGE